MKSGSDVEADKYLKENERLHYKEILSDRSEAAPAEFGQQSGDKRAPDAAKLLLMNTSKAELEDMLQS